MISDCAEELKEIQNREVEQLLMFLLNIIDL